MTKKENKENNPTIIDEEIPKNSPFARYIQACDQIILSKNGQQLDLLFKQIFSDSVNFIFPKGIPRRTIGLQLFYTNDQYIAEERKAANSSRHREVPKITSMAFVTDNGITAAINLNIERLFIDSSASIIFNFVHNIIHELNHIKNPRMSEQQIHDSGASLVETFLGIKLPESYRNYKATEDYFF